MSKVLGIDLGTTFSAMATIEGGQAKIIENAEGERTTASVIAISKSDERLVGTLARRQAITNPQNTIYSVKRLIGRRFSDPEVQRDKKLLSYEIREGKNDDVEIKMGERWYTSQEISAMILEKLKTDAEAKLGEKITDAVITCPAYFDDSQRKATRDAGEIAGLNVKRVINEPTAAALAYGFEKKKDQQIVVFDLGGGTFDISVLNIAPDTIEVKATGGDTHLGGDDFDQKVMDWIIDSFKRDEGIDLRKDPLALQRIKEAAEKTKRELSSTAQVEINLPFITSDASGPKHLAYSLKRSQLEEFVDEYIKKSIELTKKTVEESGFKIADIDEVILVGGQTRMPKIQEEVKKLFGKDPNKNINPDEVVAIGAAVDLIPKNSTVPVSKSQTFSTAADSQTSVEIHVLQGERSMAEDCKSLGKFILDGIPPAPRGIPQIEVSFDIDADGILNVKAKDKATSKEQSIRIEGSSGLSKEEVEKLKKEAELHQEEDSKKKESIELGIQADSLIYTAEKTIKENEAKISADAKEKLESQIKELKEVKEKGEKEKIKEKLEQLTKTLSEVGTELYKQSQASSSEKPQKDEKKKDDKDKKDETPSSDAKDADFEEK